MKNNTPFISTKSSFLSIRIKFRSYGGKPNIYSYCVFSFPAERTFGGHQTQTNGLLISLDFFFRKRKLKNNNIKLIQVLTQSYIIATKFLNFKLSHNY